MNAIAVSLESPDTASHPSTGGRLSTADGRSLPLRSAQLSAEARGGVARVILTQRFVNPHPEALHVTYLLPLPSDGAVAGFAFVIDGRRVVGEVDRRQAARERFEQALVEGRTAALLEQERSSLFTQEVGNIPPRAEVDVEIEIDQRLRWMPEGAWEWRFPTVVGARYLGQEGRVADPERVTVDVAERGVSARVGLALSIGDALAEGPVESPSHRLVIASAERSGAQRGVAIRASGGPGGEAPWEEPPEAAKMNDRGPKSRVTLVDGAALDRDVVVRWPVATPKVGVSLALSRPAAPAHDGKAYGLLTIVPPSVEAEAVSRDLIFLIDVSGSMHGEPLDQLKRVAAAMIDTLGPEDRIELIAFGSEPVRFSKTPIAATRDGKKSALAWLRALRASGATEMVKAALEALRPLRADAQRQVVLMTDGYIGFERELVREVRANLPKGARLHTVGVGSAVNRTLTQWAARAGNGVELIVAPSEDPERVAARLLARTSAPVVTDITIEGALETAPARVPDLYAGAPSLVSLALAPGGTLTVRGRTASGELTQRVEVPAIDLGEGLPAVATLFGRERVEDLETEAAAAGHDARIDGEIEGIGLAFQIATRMTSWVAVSDDVTVDPEAERRRVRQPHEVPHGVSIEGLGLRAPAALASSTLTGGGFAFGAPPPAPMPSAPLAAPAMASPPAEGMAAWSSPPVYSPQPREPMPKRRGPRGWLWLIVLALLALAAVGAWLALRSSDASAPPTPPETPAAERIEESAPRE